VPLRGEIWLTDFEPVRGHEEGRTRPALIVSTDPFNNGPATLIVVVPLTTKERARMPLRVRIEPPEGGLDKTSWAICEAVRSIDKSRLIGRRPFGMVQPGTLSIVEHRLRTLLEL
jgi:mRNA interferase MazF